MKKGLDLMIALGPGKKGKGKKLDGDMEDDYEDEMSEEEADMEYPEGFEDAASAAVGDDPEKIAALYEAITCCGG